MKFFNLQVVFFATILFAPNLVTAQEGDTVTLKTLKEGEPIVIDEVLRQPARLDVKTESVGRARFRIEAELTGSEAISEARIRVWPKGQGEPEMDGTAKVVGEYVFWGHTGKDPAVMKVPVGTLIYVPPSATAMEQTVRHAISVRGDRSVVPLTVWSPYQAGEVHDAEVRFPGPETAELSLFGATYTLSIDSAGNILEGRVDPQGNTIIRE